MWNDDEEEEEEEEEEDGPLEDVEDNLLLGADGAGGMFGRFDGDTLEISVRDESFPQPTPAELREQQDAEREIRRIVRDQSEMLHKVHLVCLLAVARQWWQAASNSTVHAVILSKLARPCSTVADIFLWLSQELCPAAAADAADAADAVIVLDDDDDDDVMEARRPLVSYDDDEDPAAASKIASVLSLLTRSKFAPPVSGAECAVIVCACFQALGFEARLIVSLSPVPLRPKKVPFSGRKSADAVRDSAVTSPPAKRRKVNKKKFTAVAEPNCWWWCEVRAPGSAEWRHVDVERGLIDSRRLVAPAYKAAVGGKLDYVLAVGDMFEDVTSMYSPTFHQKNLDRVTDAWWRDTLKSCAAISGAISPASTPKTAAGANMASRDELFVTIGDSPPRVPVSTVEPTQTLKHIKKSSVKANAAAAAAEDDAMFSMAVPTAIGKFKGHRLYCLESQLTTTEMLHPKGPVQGYCKGQPVFLRSNVQELRTRDAWLKMGREVPADCTQPARTVSRKSAGERDLFGLWQTRLYDPPQAKNGRVPKNEHGTVTLFKPEMLPKGCVHLREDGLAAVAQKLGIDFGRPIVGFTFHGKRSVPDLDGIVVCSEFESVLLEAWQAHQVTKIDDKTSSRRRRARANWAKAIAFVVTRIRLAQRHAALL